MKMAETKPCCADCYVNDGVENGHIVGIVGGIADLDWNFVCQTHVTESTVMLPTLSNEEMAKIFERGRKVGEEYERAKWYWQARHLDGLLAMGWPAARPERPKNPYAPRVKAGE